MDRAGFLAALKADYDAAGLGSIDMPELGGKVYFRPATPREMAIIFRDYGDGKYVAAGHVMLRALNESGERIFEKPTFADAKAISEARAATVSKLYAAMIDFDTRRRDAAPGAG